MDFEDIVEGEGGDEIEKQTGAGGIAVKDLSADQLSAYNDVLSWIRHPTEKPSPSGATPVLGRARSFRLSLIRWVSPVSARTPARPRVSLRRKLRPQV